MHRWLERVIETLWLTAAFTIPLAFNPWGHNAFELPKAMLLRALVLLLGLATLVRAIETRGTSQPAPGRRTIPGLWPVLALGGTLTLATLFSINPRLSLWGSYERQQGLLTWGAYLALFLLTAAHMSTRVRVERLWRTLVWGSAPVVVYGLLQATGLDPLDWRTDAAAPVLSTLGRANFLASYLVLVLPLTVRQLASARRRWPYALLLAGQLVCLALTQARGAWVGLGAAAITGLVAWWAATRDRRPLAAALMLSALAVGLLVALILPGTPLPGLDRLATLGRTDAGSTAARLTIWEATLPLAAARPALGYGPETLSPIFARVFPPQLVYYQGRHVTVDRAHNLWLDLAISAGLGGVVAFCALLVILGRRAWRGLRQTGDDWQRSAGVALAAAVAGHLVDLQFGFDLTAGATVFWLILALVAALGRLRFRPGDRAHKSPAFRRIRIFRRDAAKSEFWHSEGARRISRHAVYPYLLPALAVMVLIGLVCGRPLLADVAYERSLNQPSPGERLRAAMRAVQLWPLEPAYRLGLARALGPARDRAAAERQLAAAHRLAPGAPRIWAARGALYARWAETEPSRYAQAEMAYRQALALAPNIATYHTALGLTLARQGRLAAGAAELERAVALDATDGVAYAHLARLYQALGRQEQARQAWQEAARWQHKSIHRSIHE